MEERGVYKGLGWGTLGAGRDSLAWAYCGSGMRGDAGDTLLRPESPLFDPHLAHLP